jgi:parallel beta-helix repeat protein
LCLDVDWYGLSASDYVEIGAYYMDGTVPATSDHPDFDLKYHAKPVFDGQGTTTLRGYPGETYDGLISVSYKNFVRISYLDLKRSGANGIYFVYADSCVALHVDVDFIHASGILFNYSAGGKAEGCSANKVGTGHRYFYESDWGIGMGGVNPSINTTVKNCTITNCWCEGIGFYKGADGSLAENNVVYATQKAGIYLAESENCVVRYNLVYGNTNPSFHRITGFMGMGIYVSHENRTPNWNRNNEVYGNLVAFCSTGLRLGAASNAPNNNGDHKVYNNSLVDNNLGILIYGNDVSGLELKNNIIWQPGGGDLIDQVYETGWEGADIDYNLWGSPPEEPGAVGPHDVIGDPFLCKASGWRLLEGGDLSAADFNLKENSPAIDAGISLDSMYNLDFYGETRPIGSSWDMGAFEYGGATRIPEVEDIEEDLGMEVYPTLAGNGAIMVEYVLPSGSEVEVTILDGNGITKETLLDYQGKGRHTFQVITQGYAPGIYFCRLATVTKNVVKRFIVP